MALLRSIVLECGLDEDFKWMHPCYTWHDHNIVLIHQFKEYCALLFFKGVLLKDKKKFLIQQTEHVQDQRQLRVTSLDEIVSLQETIKAYILEALQIEKAGQKITYKSTAEFVVPQEFKQRLAQDAALKKAFENLTPGRQRGYLLYFSGAKKSQTRAGRITKCVDKILSGKGLED